MRIKLEKVITRHKKANPNTNYLYDKTVLGKTLHDKVVITCPIHGDFKQAPHEHMKGQMCPDCAIEQMKNTKTTDVEDIINRSMEKFGKDSFSYEITRQTYKKVKTKCLFHCNKCNIDFETTPTYHFIRMFGGCPECKNKFIKVSKENRIKHDNEIKEGKIRAKEIKLQERLEKINKRKQEQETRKRLREEHKRLREEQRRLKEIEKQNKKKQILPTREERCEEFLLKYKKKYGDKFDISLIREEYVDSGTKIHLICHKKDKYGQEHGIFAIRPNSLLAKECNCPKCSNRYKRTKEEFIEEMKYRQLDRYEYLDIPEKPRARDKISIKCKKCCTIFSSKICDHLRGHGCPYCKRSKLELCIESLLKRHNIKFEPQCSSFEWLGLQSFDFYLPDYNIAIECQGRQHFETVEAFGGQKNFEKTIRRDLIKKQLCKEHNVKLIYYLEKQFEKYMQDDDRYFTKPSDLMNFLKNIS